MSLFSKKPSKKATRLFFVTGCNDDDPEVLKAIKREGVLRGCLVTFMNGEVQGYQMTSG
jgi:hypothetical protein